jgi:hypothetical protein
MSLTSANLLNPMSAQGYNLNNSRCQQVLLTALNNGGESNSPLRRRQTKKPPSNALSNTLPSSFLRDKYHNISNTGGSNIKKSQNPQMEKISLVDNPDLYISSNLCGYCASRYFDTFIFTAPKDDLRNGKVIAFDEFKNYKQPFFEEVIRKRKKLLNEIEEKKKELKLKEKEEREKLMEFDLNEKKNKKSSETTLTGGGGHFSVVDDDCVFEMDDDSYDFGFTDKLKTTTNNKGKKNESRSRLVDIIGGVGFSSLSPSSTKSLNTSPLLEAIQTAFNELEDLEEQIKVELDLIYVWNDAVEECLDKIKEEIEGLQIERKKKKSNNNNNNNVANYAWLNKEIYYPSNILCSLKEQILHERRWFGSIVQFDENIEISSLQNLYSFSLVLIDNAFHDSYLRPFDILSLFSFCPPNQFSYQTMSMEKLPSLSSGNNMEHKHLHYNYPICLNTQRLILFLDRKAQVHPLPRKNVFIGKQWENKIYDSLQYDKYIRSNNKTNNDNDDVPLQNLTNNNNNNNENDEVSAPNGQDNRVLSFTKDVWLEREKFYGRDDLKNKNEKKKEKLELTKSVKAKSVKNENDDKALCSLIKDNNPQLKRKIDYPTFFYASHINKHMLTQLHESLNTQMGGSVSDLGKETSESQNMTSLFNEIIFDESIDWVDRERFVSIERGSRTMTFAEEKKVKADEKENKEFDVDILLNEVTDEIFDEAFSEMNNNVSIII